MPPKKLFSQTKSINFNYSNNVSSTGSRKINSNHVRDLITKSQAALSSQASIYQTQRTQLSQGNPNQNNNFDADYIDFNRDQIGQEVFITKEQENIIQQILEISRKGKINSKNAFQIPLKVLNTQSKQQNAGNKFWKFASQLLNASMSIYQKRVENIYISTNTMTNKLTRINTDMRDGRRNNTMQQEYNDDVQDNEQRQNRQKLRERQQMLNISIDNFSGELSQMEDGWGYSTLEHKSKIDIKNIQDKFVADPMFARTQKMFDSYSLKSLMLNIFSVNDNLQVQIFNKISLQENQKNQNNELQKHQNVKLQIQNDSQNINTQTNKSIKEKIKSQKRRQFLQNSNQSIDQSIQRQIVNSKFILQDSGIFTYLQKWIEQQPQLNKDYFYRNNDNKSQNRLINQNQRNDNVLQQIIQKQQEQFNQIFQEFDQGLNQNTNNFNMQGHKGLYQTKQANSQPISTFYAGQGSFQHIAKHSYTQQQYHTAPISHLSTFFQYHSDGNIDPIMPWDIQFKNNKLIKKRKVAVNKLGTKAKNSKKNVDILKIDFDTTIVKRQDALKAKENKNKFKKMIVKKQNFSQKNTIMKQLQTVYNEYNTQRSRKFKDQNIAVNNQSMKILDTSQLNQENNFVFDNNHNMFDSENKKQLNNSPDDQTHYNQPFQSHPHPSASLQSMNTFSYPNFNYNNSSFIGRGMGINNIRQIKKMIYNEICQNTQVSMQKVSKLIPLSPAQLFTIFLHLVNEHNLEIKENEDQTDIKLRMGQERRQRQRQQHEEIEI